VNLKATSTFSPVALSKITAIIIPKMVAAMNESVALVQDEAQAIVPVRTGELKASIETEVTWSGNAVEGEVSANAPHAAYVEFGTGQRGAASAGAGPYPYTESWPGMPAQPYMRPALDQSRTRIVGIFEEHLKS
jgi:HK97 gp10 family phage protein